MKNDVEAYEKILTINDNFYNNNKSPILFQNKILLYLKSKNNEEKDEKIDELIYYLIQYKKKFQKNISFYARKQFFLLNNQKNNSKELNEDLTNFDCFQKNVYDNLESLINTLLYIDNLSLRKEKIKTIYNWFFKCYNFYHELKNIKEKTSKLPNEIYSELELNQNNKKIVEKYHEDYLNEVENNGLIHRTNEINFFKPNELLKEKKVKNITIKINKNKFTKSIKYDIKKLKEFKGSYSYNRPPYQFYFGKGEQDIIIEKNKLIQEKRNSEEINEALLDYGKKVALYRMNLNNKHEIKKLIEIYNKKNSTSIKKKILNLFSTNKSKKELKKSFSFYMKLNNLEKKKNNSDEIENITILKKVDINNIKNLDKNQIIKDIPINSNKKYDFSCKLKNLFKSKIYNIKREFNDDKIPSDIIYKKRNDDKIFKNRSCYKTMCGFQELHKPILNYSFNPLSGYDLFNYKTNFYNKYFNSDDKEEENQNNKYILFNSTNYFCKKNYNKNKNNLLELRKNMNNSKIFELNRLKNRIIYNSHSNCSILENNYNINENRHLTQRKNIKELLNNFNNSNVQNDIINETNKSAINILNNKKNKNFFNRINMKNLSNAFLNKYNDNEFFPNLYLPNLEKSLLNLPLNNLNISKISKN